MNDLISRQAAIDTEGLDEEIRCEMCRNPMHTDRGCDGGCTYDEKLYKRIMQILDERIKPLPSAQPEITHCAECLHWKHSAVRKSYCEVFDWVNTADDFCSFAESKDKE